MAETASKRKGGSGRLRERRLRAAIKVFVWSIWSIWTEISLSITAGALIMAGIPRTLFVLFELILFFFLVPTVYTINICVCVCIIVYIVLLICSESSELCIKTYY